MASASPPPKELPTMEQVSIPSASSTAKAWSRQYGIA